MYGPHWCCLMRLHQLSADKSMCLLEKCVSVKHYFCNCHLLWHMHANLCM